MKKVILALAIVALFICMNFAVAGANSETKIQENKKQINNSSTTAEPDYKFESVNIELNGNCTQRSLPGTYARWIKMPVPFTDYEWTFSYCLYFWVKDKKPCNRLQLTDGYFDITTPDGQTLKIVYDGDTHIDYVSEKAKASRYDPEKSTYYFKGILRQGVEIYL